MKIMNDKRLNQKDSSTLSWLMMIFVGISGCFSVLCGAWLAHAGKTLPEGVQASVATALQYQFIHTLALLSCLVWLKNGKSSRVLLCACIAFTVGIVCFSGAIYLTTIFGLTSFSKLTPLGGMTLALGWILLAFQRKPSL